MSSKEEGRKESFLAQSKMFKSITKWAFNACDGDQSGQIHKDELYTGLLLVHLKIAKKVGPAACFPATKETVDKLFDACDADKSGTIDEHEFSKIMIVCCGQIVSRVMIYLALLLFISPCVAHITVMRLESVLAGKAWFKIVVHLFQDPISKVPWLDTMFDWDTLAEDILGVAFFFAVFPVVFDSIDRFYQAAAASEMLSEISNLENDKKSEKAD